MPVSSVKDFFFCVRIIKCLIIWYIHHTVFYGLSFLSCFRNIGSFRQWQRLMCPVPGTPQSWSLVAHSLSSRWHSRSESWLKILQSVFVAWCSQSHSLGPLFLCWGMRTPKGTWSTWGSILWWCCCNQTRQCLQRSTWIYWAINQCIELRSLFRVAVLTSDF